MTLGIRIDHKNCSSDLMMTSMRLFDVSYDRCTTAFDWYSDSQKNKYSPYSRDCLAWGEKHVLEMTWHHNCSMRHESMGRTNSSDIYFSEKIEAKNKRIWSDEKSIFTFKDKAPPTEQTNVLLSVIAVLLLYPLMFEPKQ